MVKPDINQIRNPFNDDPKDKIKKDILAEFRRIKADVGHTLPHGWLVMRYPATLNPKEKAFFQEAINELVAEGLVEMVNNDNLRLTQKGVDTIY